MACTQVTIPIKILYKQLLLSSKVVFRIEWKVWLSVIFEFHYVGTWVVKPWVIEKKNWKWKKNKMNSDKQKKKSSLYLVWLRNINWCLEWLRIDWLPWKSKILIKIVTFSTHIFSYIHKISHISPSFFLPS